jgi:hypothetical protein
MKGLFRWYYDSNIKNPIYLFQKDTALVKISLFKNTCRSKLQVKVIKPKVMVPKAKRLDGDSITHSIT